MTDVLELDAYSCSTMDDSIAWISAQYDAGRPPAVVFTDMQLADPLRVSTARLR